MQIECECDGEVHEFEVIVEEFDALMIKYHDRRSWDGDIYFRASNCGVSMDGFEIVETVGDIVVVRELEPIYDDSDVAKEMRKIESVFEDIFKYVPDIGIPGSIHTLN